MNLLCTPLAIPKYVPTQETDLFDKLLRESFSDVFTNPPQVCNYYKVELMLLHYSHINFQIDDELSEDLNTVRRNALQALLDTR